MRSRHHVAINPMAHDCIFCDGACYCSGDIDDIFFPDNETCIGCGCDDWINDDEDDFVYGFDVDESYVENENAFECLRCGNLQNHEGECEMCGSYDTKPPSD